MGVGDCGGDRAESLHHKFSIISILRLLLVPTTEEVQLFSEQTVVLLDVMVYRWKGSG